MDDCVPSTTTGPESDFRRRFFRALRDGAREWTANEGVALVFTAKALLASALAFGIGYGLDLENPRWSVVSIFIVMQPESGLVLEKGFYRILATLIGCVVSLAMVSLFSQYGELFLGALALWLGFCVACSLRFRNYQAYAWALAGYTATIVGLPAAAGNPDGAFASAVARATEIGVGVACAGLVGALVFPRTSEARLRRQTRERFSDFVPHALSVFRRHDGAEADAGARDRLFDGLAEQDSAMSAAAFENPHRPDFVVRVRRFNRDFVGLSTRLHLLLQLRLRLRARGDATLEAALDAQAAALPESADAGAIRAARGRILADAPARAATLASAGARADFATHTGLFAGFADDLAAHTDAFADLEKPLRPGDAGEPPYVTTRIDRALAALAGARVAITVALLSAFWIGSDWPDGVMAIMCAAISAALCASSPRPVAMLWQAQAAFLAAIPAGFVFRFFLMPAAHGFVPLFLAIAPFLALAAYSIARPKRFLFGLFFSVWFLTLAGPENNPTPDLAVFFGQSLAGLAGNGMALLMFALFLPNGSRWVRRRERRHLRRLVMDVCLDESPGFAGRFDHESRAALRRIAGNRSAGAGEGGRDRMARWCYAALEIGGAMTGFRAALAGMTLSPELGDTEKRVREAVAEVFRAPSVAAFADALATVGDAEIRFAESSYSGAADYLHLMKTALLDPDSPLAGDDDAEPLEREARHA